MGKDTAIVPLLAGLPVGLPDLSSDLSLGLGADSSAHEFVLMHQMHKGADPGNTGTVFSTRWHFAIALKPPI